MTDKDIMAICQRLLRPYRIPPECPYLSEDQCELSTLDLRGRSAWMAEWLALANTADRASARRNNSNSRVTTQESEFRIQESEFRIL